MTIIAVLGRLRQEDHKFEDSFDSVVRPSQKNKTKNLVRLQLARQPETSSF
jgi:hypothetical protein